MVLHNYFFIFLPLIHHIVFICSKSQRKTEKELCTFIHIVFYYKKVSRLSVHIRVLVTFYLAITQLIHRLKVKGEELKKGGEMSYNSDRLGDSIPAI